MKIFKNYKSSIILIGAIIIGGIVGLIWKDGASVLKPFGDLFLNLLLIIIIPLIFLTIGTSIYKMKQPKRIKKILMWTFIIFLITALVSTLIGVVSTYSFKLINTENSEMIRENLNAYEETSETVEMNFLERTVDAISVNDFVKLLSRDNMVALIVVSILVGIAMSMSKEKAKPVFEFMDSALNILINFIKIIMYYAPIGLGCYFAVLVGTFGDTIMVGYAKTFIVYLITSLIIYFVIYTLYAYIAAGRKGMRQFWKNILPSTLTALATCSSAASIPVNMESTKKIGVSSDVAETTVSLGTSFHKDGSVIGSVFKVMFLVYLFDSDISILKVIGVSMLATLLISAVPIGGGIISEMLIITMLGFPTAALPILTIIATIIDSPATVLNVTGDSAAAMMINRFVDGKNWINKKA